VDYALLRRIVDREGYHFQQIEDKWRPQDLILLPQVRLILQDIERRYNHLSAAEDELSTLIRAPVYIKLVRRMRIQVRDANFAWKADQLKFIQSVSHFYSDYGTILRLLKRDLEQGRLADQPS
jgi:hypothetical protein